MTNYLQELHDLGVDESRIVAAAANDMLAELYDQIMFECSEEQFPIKAPAPYYYCRYCDQDAVWSPISDEVPDADGDWVHVWPSDCIANLGQGLEVRKDDEPCCYGWVTSAHQVHEVDCPRFDG